MIKVIPYAQGHFDFLEVRHVYAGDSDLENRIGSLIGEATSLCYTFIKEDKAIAVLGGNLLWPGVMEVWTVTTDLITEYPLEFHKKVRDVISGLEKELEIKRFQATVRADFDMGKKWLHSLGFISEGLLKKYGPEGEDYFMFGRVI